ncbi:hypothetical protein J6590_102524, partial [Homalodisca vitripennis]
GRRYSSADVSSLRMGENDETDGVRKVRKGESIKTYKQSVLQLFIFTLIGTANVRIVIPLIQTFG